MISNLTRKRIKTPTPQNKSPRKEKKNQLSRESTRSATTENRRKHP
jgi:hypothetical protein